MVPLTWYLLVAAFVFGCGLYASLARRNAIAVLIGIELMLNSVNINLVAFWRYNALGNPDAPQSVGFAWAIFVLTVAAAEAAIGLALVISVYRRRDSVVAEELSLLKN